MPATRSRSSTEAAEVASEDVKVPAEAPVDAPVVQDEVAPSEAEAVAAPVPEEAASGEAVPAVEVPAVETNGSSEAVAETNGNAVVEAAPVEPVAEPEVVENGKRKSDVGGEGDGPDSTEVAPIKKAKVDEETAEDAVPVVEASV